MKIQFDRNLDFQLETIDAACSIFEGQNQCKTNFTIVNPSKDKKGHYKMAMDDLGVGNKLQLLPEEILENIRKTQIKFGLKQTEKLISNDFTFELETGVGKSYIFLRTIFELNERFGFTKFIIVVPSIAIKEGAYKNLQITQEHFKSIYEGINYDYFIYDSQELEQVRSFATNDYIQIMVINIDAFRKSFNDPAKEDKANIIHRYNDKLGYPPIELIKATNPIVIIDEPQSVDSTDKSKEAIASLNPMCTLRYSATHKNKYNLLYKLDSVDAYERKLVKQIEVAAIEVESYQNQAYIRLEKVDNKKSPITATIEVDVNDGGRTIRKKIKVKQNDDLGELTRRQIYDGYIIKDIYCEPGNEYIDFTSKTEYVALGQTIGSIDESFYKRIQIRKTIEEHLNKELVLNPKNIKVLSLFFIDKVANYRIYDEEGNVQKGKFAKMFEEEYKSLIVKPKYKNLFKDIRDLDVEVEEIHNGYFSIDKKSKKSNKKETFEIIKDTTGSTKADEDTFNLIMKDKEKLLSFNSKLRFIFSHSALKEGWDNPNVFQICTLNETTSTMRKRQEIGRGLRLCVNQDGERVLGFDVNTLTVMANESYEDFVTKLQKEIEEDTGIRFGIIDDHSFANLVIDTTDDNPVYLGQKESEELYSHYIKLGYIDLKGKIQDKLKIDLQNGNVDIPDKYKPIEGQITKQLKKVAGNLNIKNADEREKIQVNKEIMLSSEFKSLWDKIKFKTTYSVDFDSDKLIEKCVDDIKINLYVSKGKLIYKKAKTEISKGGVYIEKEENTDKEKFKIEDMTIEYAAKTLPDIISYLQNETNLTRKSIVEILIKSERLDAFKYNPQKFIDGVIEIIRTQMRHFIVDGIVYKKIGDKEYYAQELFENEDLYGHLKQNMKASTKSPYEYVVYDSSTIEAPIIEKFEQSENVKVYAKLPSWFKIETPLGNYNPDWAILWEEDGKEKLYFVVETKGALSWEMLRATEKGKIECGKKHFAALGNDVKLEVASSYQEMRDKIMSIQ